MASFSIKCSSSYLQHPSSVLSMASFGKSSASQRDMIYLHNLAVPIRRVFDAYAAVSTHGFRRADIALPVSVLPSCLLLHPLDARPTASRKPLPQIWQIPAFQPVCGMPGCLLPQTTEVSCGGMSGASVQLTSMASAYTPMHIWFCAISSKYSLSHSVSLQPGLHFLQKASYSL